MTTKKKILVFTATYNERDNIERLIQSILSNCSYVDILIIDDNSPDKTFEKIQEEQNKYKNIFLLKRESKLGLDTAHKKAYDYAIKNDYDILITMDADLSHDPKEIKNFIYNLERFPFVIGSRYIDGGQCLMKGRRLIFSKYGNIIIKFLLNLNLVKNKGYSFFMGTLFEIVNHGFAIKEVTIIFKDRDMGVSKIPKVEIFSTLINLLILFFKKKLKK